jgi:uncharacterized alkaline shock family protein YloU
MSEQVGTQQESPLQSERGTTTIKDSVVQKIAGVAASGVEGVHMGGKPQSGGLLGSVTGSDNQTRGIKVEVGRVETAIDLTMGIDYGRNILEAVDEVRSRISEQVGNITGLRITELNVTINNIVFPDDEDDGDRRQLTSGKTGGETGSEAQPEPRPEVRTMPSRELRPGARERESTPVEPRSRTYAEGSSGPVPEEEVRVEERPLEEDETARLRIEDDDRTQEIDKGRVSESEPRRAPSDFETGTGRSGESEGRSGSRRRRPSGESGDRPEGS